MNIQNFEWVTKKWVRSSDGFEVKSLGAYEIEYLDLSGIQIRIKRELGFNESMKPCVLVSEQAFDAAGPKKLEVKKNFVAAMNFQGLDVSFEL